MTRFAQSALFAAAASVVSLGLSHQVSSQPVAPDNVPASSPATESGPVASAPVAISIAPVNLNDLTKAELLDYAAKHNVKVASRWTKAKLIEVLAVSFS